MTGHDPDSALLARAIEYLLDRGAPIDLAGDAQDLRFEIEGQPASESQVILKAYALGMAEAAHRP